MEFIKEVKRAGEPTYSIPLELCTEAYNQLDIWKLYESPEMMQQGLRESIEGVNRFEYRATDEAGNIIAMMIISDSQRMAHAGNKNILYTMYSFSTQKGALTEGYKWLKELAKRYGFPLIMITRQTGPMSIQHTLREVAQ